jgi:hypothetical protein
MFSDNFVANFFVNFPEPEELFLDNVIVKVRLGVSKILLSRSRKCNTKLTQNCERDL